MSLEASFIDDCRAIRQRNPVIHNITNYVAMNFTANALLAVGASPIMSSEPSEMEEIVSSSSALAINLGCLEKIQIEAMRIAAATARKNGIPWVLDPVGAGISRLRTETAFELIESFHPQLVRCNVSEIMALCGVPVRTRGVDSPQENELSLDAAVEFARKHGTSLSISGPTDIILDGNDIIKIKNGNPIMPGVTAMGCAASALTAAFLAVDSVPVQAAANAMALMGVAGEKAAPISQGPGSMVVNFIDTLYSLDPEEAAKLVRYE